MSRWHLPTIRKKERKEVDDKEDSEEGNSEEEDEDGDSTSLGVRIKNRISDEIAKKEKVEHVGLCFLEWMKLSNNLANVGESLVSSNGTLHLLFFYGNKSHNQSAQRGNGKNNFEKVDDQLYITIDMVKELATASDGLFQFATLKPIAGGWELLEAALGPSRTSEYITSFNRSSQIDAVVWDKAYWDYLIPLHGCEVKF